MISTTLLRSLGPLLLVAALAACTDSGFSGSGGGKASQDAKPKDKSDDDTDLGDREKEDPTDDVDRDDDDEDTSIEDLDAGEQEGRSVEACFAYDKEKMLALVDSGQALHGHMCNRAVFDVLTLGEKVGQIDLNNDTGDGIDIFGGGDYRRFSGPSVLGGKFTGKWVGGKFDIETRCALPKCHEDVSFLSLIGEVVTASGKKKWLKIDQGVIVPNQRYQYEFAKFTLTNKKPKFGPFCELQ